MATRNTVLLLEDEALIAMATEDLIRDLGFYPVVSATIDDAISHVENGGIDVAVLDYKIRDQTSEPVALALRRKSIPFIVCSGVSLQPDGGAFDGAPQLSKPYSDGELHSAILSALSSRAR